MSKHNANKQFSVIMLGGSALVLLWVTAAFISALYHANWQMGTLIHHYMVATGLLQPMHTLVDFYTHIKGVEYLICVAFFVAFPIFFKYVNKERRLVTVQK